MKRLFFGLAVAVVALSASAFTGMKTPKLATYYVTGAGTSSSTYTYSSTDPLNCGDDLPSPCEFTTKQGYAPPAGNQIPRTDFVPAKIIVVSTRPAL